MTTSVNNNDFVTIRLAGQLCGIPVLTVHDVLSHRRSPRSPWRPAMSPVS